MAYVKKIFFCPIKLPSTEEEKMPDGNAIRAPAQGSVVDDELPLPVLKAFVQDILSLHTIRND